MGPFFPDPVFGWTYYLVLVAITGLAAYLDFSKLIIPKWLTLGTLALGVVFSMVRSAGLVWVGQTDGLMAFKGTESVALGALDGLLFSLAGFVLAFAVFLVMFILNTCGGGDVKLFAAIGAWGGVSLTLLLLAGTVVFVILLWLGGVTYGMATRGVGRTTREYSAKRSAPKSKGGSAREGVRVRKRTVIAYSTALALSVLLVVLVRYRTELLPQQQADPQPAKGDIGQMIPRGEA